jgi:hypothetical protein
VDNIIGPIGIIPVLPVGASETLTAGGNADAGQYANLGTAIGEYNEAGDTVTDEDPSHYEGLEPCLEIEKTADYGPCGSDPDNPANIGDIITYTIVVRNCGEVILHNVTVVDEKLEINENVGTLNPGEEAKVEGTYEAGEGDLPEIHNTAVADSDETDPPVDDSWCVPVVAEFSGCTPGYYKNLDKHEHAWDSAGYDPGQSVDSVFDVPSDLPAHRRDKGPKDLGLYSLHEALSFSGGPGVLGAARNLLRSGVAALLNAAHPGIQYGYDGGSPASVIDAVNAALATEDRGVILALHGELDLLNNEGCPLNNRPWDDQNEEPQRAPARLGTTSVPDAYPNPFNPEVWMPYRLGQGVAVRITLYSASGHLVRTLDLGYQAAGDYVDKSKAAYWDGRNEAGELVSSGIYFYTFQAGNFTAIKKLVMIK